MSSSELSKYQKCDAIGRETVGLPPPVGGVGITDPLARIQIECQDFKTTRKSGLTSHIVRQN